MPAPLDFVGRLQGAGRAALKDGRLAWALTAFSVLVLALALAVQLTHEWSVELETQRDQSEVMARVLEDHSTRSIDQVSLVLATLAEQVAEQDGERHIPDHGLRSLREGFPQLQGWAIVHESGQVLASTSPQDLGLTLARRRLGVDPQPGTEALGPWVPGRGLADLVAEPPSRPSPGTGFVPLVRAVRTARGETLWIVALLEPEALSQFMRRTLASETLSAVLTSANGQVLSAGHAGLPGLRLAHLPPFQGARPAQGHGVYVGSGSEGEERLVAFRASPTRPLVVLVEQPLAVLQQQWWRRVDLQVWAALGIAVLLVLLGASTARGLRAHHQRRQRIAQDQADLERRERELSALADNVHALLFRTDEQGRLRYVNARWTELGAEPAMGRPLVDLASPEDGAVIQDLLARAARTGAPEHAQVHLGPRLYDLSLTSLQTESTLSGFAGSAQDITERWEAERRLVEALAFSEQLFELSPLPISMLDARGVYRRVNRAWEAFTGRQRAEVLGRAAGGYLPPSEAERHDAVDRQLLSDGLQVQYEAQVRDAAGAQRDVLINKAAIPGASGRLELILVIFMDVSDLRRAERDTLAARDLAEEASRVKSEFIANVSHELRTPLQSILGFSELGLVRGRQHAALGGMFQDIHAAGKRMLALVDDLLDVSKLESSVGTLHLERTDLRPLLREVALEVQPQLAQRHLHLQLDLAEQPLVLKVDPLRIQQVVRNVLANAIKFSPPGGSIQLSAGVCDGGDGHIAVRDQGPGIPPAELERIFEAFVQSSRTQDGSGGTGLGLAICERIVTAHGGRIHAENLGGGGSCFHVHLPRRRAADTGLAPLGPA